MGERTLWTNQDTQITKKTVPTRELGPYDVQIKPRAVAINPTDYKHLKFKFAEGAGSGVDFAGEITAVGSSVDGYKVGDTVFGMAGGGNKLKPADGAYTDVLYANTVALLSRPDLKEDSSSEIPSSKAVSFEQAASLPVGILTSALAFYHYNDTPLVKGSKSGYALIYGAVSSLGFQAAQLAQYLGYTVIAVASKKHAKLLESIGVTHLVDYHDDDWVKQAKAISDDIVYAYDTIAEQATFDKVYEAVSDKSPVKINLSLWTVNLPEKKKDNVTYDAPLAYFLGGTEKYFGDYRLEEKNILPKTPTIYKEVNRLLKEGLFQALPIEVIGTGLDKVPELFERYEKGISGTKIVLRV